MNSTTAFKTKFCTLLSAMIFTWSCSQPYAETDAVADMHHTMGMVLIEGEDKVRRLVLMVCKNGSMPIGNIELQQGIVCKNAFVDHEGKPYYFTKLDNKEIRNAAFINGYSRLSVVVVLPIAVIALLASTRGGSKVLIKILRNLGLSKKEAGFKSMLAGGAILSGSSLMVFYNYYWGQDARVLWDSWDDIFFTQHGHFYEPKLLQEDEHMVRKMLQFLADKLHVRINPELDSLN